MSTVIYVAIVEGEQDRGYSAFFPDLPGCVTAADTMVELPSSARDALSLHLQGMAEDGDVFPEPTALEEIKADPEVREIGHILVDAEVEDAPVRVNISIGAQFLKRVDAAAEARGMSRSGFLVEAARAALEARGGRQDIADRWATHLANLACTAEGLVAPGEVGEDMGWLEPIDFLNYPVPPLGGVSWAPLQYSLESGAGKTVKVPARISRRPKICPTKVGR